MIVENSNLSLATSRRVDVSTERVDTLETWRGENHRDQQSVSERSVTKVSISESARLTLDSERAGTGAVEAASSREESPAASELAPGATALPQLPAAAAASPDASASEIEAAVDAANNDPRVTLIRSMVEKLLGRAVKVFSVSDLPPSSGMATLASGKESLKSLADNSALGAVYRHHEIRQETESTSFSAEGTVVTADGRSIQFKLEMQMQSSVRQEILNEKRTGVALRDPLVINFSGGAPELLDQRFQFDLNADGKKEDVPLLGSGSGFLAFDRNGNGTVDDGRELFGPVSNNGFAELAKLDADGNGWIDSADPAFSRLGVWQPSAGKGKDGKESTGEWQSLASAGIGALSLASLQTPLALRGAGQRELGQVRESGVALTEQGQALGLQEIDLAV